MKTILPLLTLVCLLAISCTNKQKRSRPDAASTVCTAVTGGGDTITGTTVAGKNNGQDRDTVIYELPQCWLWHTEALPAGYAGKPARMWTEYKNYWENVQVIQVFVANPDTIPFDFGRKWDLYVWKEGKYVRPEQKGSYSIAWEDDLFIIGKAPLLYCFRFPVGDDYYLPVGKYRITKKFGQRGKEIELHADFEVK